MSLANDTTKSSARIVDSFKSYADFYRDSNAAPYTKVAALIKQNCHRVGVHGTDAHILDIGCGAAFTIDLLEDKFSEISLLDPNPFFRAQWLEKTWFKDDKHVLHLYPCTVEQAIGANLIRPNSIDAVILYHSIYHFALESLQQTLAKIVGFLKPGGVCVISVIDDDHELISQYRKLSPEYGLSTRVETMLDSMKNIACIKEYETDEFCLPYEAHLQLLEWIFIQDCMNRNYLPEGITEQQRWQVHELCKQFLESNYSKSEHIIDSSGKTETLYKGLYTAIHFVVTKSPLQLSKL